MSDASVYSITDFGSVANAAACMHDARIPNSGFRFRRPSQTFELVAWQYSPFSYTGPSCVWIRWELTFRDVNGFRQRRTESASTHHYHELATMRWYPRRQMILISTHFDLTVYLKVTKLNGKLRPTDDHSKDIDPILNNQV
ncbi:hypothetical protein [Posidoniimonas polymericola]|nr:hypothetical protein [Posidoniimonas polymericola]